MGAMTLLVTGAGGHVGRAVVACAQARGHRVRALYRATVDPPPGVEGLRADLARDPLDQALAGIDAVIHAAAAVTGEPAQMQRDTVAATRALMQAVGRAAVPRVVLVGSMAVYGTQGLCPGAVVDETTALETRPALRDAYCRAKLAQEDVARDIARQHGTALWVMRAGAVWGPGRLWNAHLGLALGPVLLRIGDSPGEIPLVHQDRCAAGLVTAAETAPTAGFEIVNLLDADRPDRRRYVTALRRGGWPRIVLPVPWRVPDLAAWALTPLAPRLPGLLRRPALRARLMPLLYGDQKLRARLALPDGPGFEAAMQAASGDGGRP